MANLTRWEPFNDSTWSLRQAMDRLFEDAWVHPWGAARPGDDGSLRNLAVDMYETGDDVIVSASVPGVRPDDIEITVQGEILTIRGQSQAEKDENQANYHLRERRVGSFQRQLALPASVKSDAAEARFDNGILTLRLPKAEAAKERKIQVQTTTSSPQIKAANAA
jgi:HSP20 family protein